MRLRNGGTHAKGVPLFCPSRPARRHATCKVSCTPCCSLLPSLLCVPLLLFRLSGVVDAQADVRPPSDVIVQVLEPAVRVVRFRIDYPTADLDGVASLQPAQWQQILRKSVLASLKFVNRHWLICGDLPERDGDGGIGGDRDADKANCGKLQVTGEPLDGSLYRVNATFISNRDPIQNAKVDATSTVFGVVQIGLRGGIFQYTNAMKLLGKPSSQLDFEEAFFCYPGLELTDADKCQRMSGAAATPPPPPHRRHHRHRRAHRRGRRHVVVTTTAT